MKPAKQEFVDELLEEASRRPATLRLAGEILRRRRHRRLAWRTGAFILFIFLTILFVKPDRPSSPPAPAANVAPRLAVPPQARSLTDDQLLSLFPNTPVGLAKLPDGRKLLIFPRPADQARYVTHL